MALAADIYRRLRRRSGCCDTLVWSLVGNGGGLCGIFRAWRLRKIRGEGHFRTVRMLFIFATCLGEALAGVLLWRALGGQLGAHISRAKTWSGAVFGSGRPVVPGPGVGRWHLSCVNGGGLMIR